MANEALTGRETATPEKTSLTLDAAVDKLMADRTSEPEPAPEPDPTPEPALEPLPDPDGSGQVEPDENDEEIDWSLLEGDDATSDDIETTDAEPELSLTLEHKGETRTVNREEATRLAQMGLDYTKRSEALARDQREFEAVSQQARETYEGEIAKLQETREALAKRLAKYTEDLQPPDPALADTDPEAYNAQAAKYDAAMRAADADARELDRQNEEARQKAQARTDAAMAQHMKRLHARVPAMKDQKNVDAVGGYMVKHLGFTKDDLVVKQRIHPVDSRFLEMAYKAMKYDKARLKAKQLRAKAGKTTSSSGRGGRSATKPTSADEAKAKVKKTGRPEDAVNALLARRGAS